MMNYLVYSNPEGKTVDFVRDTMGQPRIYEDLLLAEQCANKEENGYVVPLGFDLMDFAERAREHVTDLMYNKDSSQEKLDEIDEFVDEATIIIQQ